MGNLALFLNSQQRDEQLPWSKLVFVRGYFDGPGEAVKNSLAFRTGKGKGFVTLREQWQDPIRIAMPC